MTGAETGFGMTLTQLLELLFDFFGVVALFNDHYQLACNLREAIVIDFHLK